MRYTSAYKSARIGSEEKGVCAVIMRARKEKMSSKCIVKAPKEWSPKAEVGLKSFIAHRRYISHL